MNREDVIQLASEQGDFSESKYGCAFIFNAQPEDTFNIFNFAAAIEQRTLERAAQVAEEPYEFTSTEASSIAAAIRTLKDKA